MRDPPSASAETPYTHPQNFGDVWGYWVICIYKIVLYIQIFKKNCFCTYINKIIVYLYIQRILIMDYDKVFNLRLSELQLNKLRELGSDVGMSEWLRRCIDGSSDASVSKVGNVVSEVTDKKLSADKLKDMVDKFHAKRKK